MTTTKSKHAQEGELSMQRTFFTSIIVLLVLLVVAPISTHAGGGKSPPSVTCQTDACRAMRAAKKVGPIPYDGKLACFRVTQKQQGNVLLALFNAEDGWERYKKGDTTALIRAYAKWMPTRGKFCIGAHQLTKAKQVIACNADKTRGITGRRIEVVRQIGSASISLYR